MFLLLPCNDNSLNFHFVISTETGAISLRFCHCCVGDNLTHAFHLILVTPIATEIFVKANVVIEQGLRNNKYAVLNS